MTNEELINYLLVTNSRCYLSKNGLDRISKSQVNLHDVIKILKSKGYESNKEYTWHTAYNIVKLCERHKIPNKDLKYTIDKIFKLYDDNINGYSVIQVLEDVNERSPLDINYNMFNIYTISSRIIDIFGYKIPLKACHPQNSISYLESKAYDILGYSIHNIQGKTYDRQDGLGKLVQDILNNNYDKLYICNFLGRDVYWIKRVVPSNIKTGEYLKLLCALRMINLTQSVNLNQLEGLLNTKHNLIELISTVVRLGSITSIVKVKFLLKINELVKNSVELEALNAVLKMFSSRVLLKQDILKNIINSDWYSIQELLESLKRIDIEAVHMIKETDNSNHYYDFYENGRYRHVNGMAEVSDKVTGNILVKKNRTIFNISDNMYMTEIDDIILTR